MKNYITRTQFNLFSKKLLVKSKRPRIYESFDVINAIYYILITGSQWRNLPENYPPFKLVFFHYSKWKKGKIFHVILAWLQNRYHRSKPIVLIIDNQSISDSDLPANRYKGYDGHKKRKGRKRCILIDQDGNISCAKYYPANYHDTVCAKAIIEYYKETRFGRTNKTKVYIYGDKGFHSPATKQEIERKYKNLIEYQAISRLTKPDTTTKIGLELYKEQYGYMHELIIKSGWKVERTFAWLQKYRRLNLNYERTISSLESMIILAGIRIFLKRLRVV